MPAALRRQPVCSFQLVLLKRADNSQMASSLSELDLPSTEKSKQDYPPFQESLPETNILLERGPVTPATRDPSPLDTFPFPLLPQAEMSLCSHTGE